MRAQSVNLPAFASLSTAYNALMSTAHDQNVQTDYFLYLTAFFHEERLEAMRTAITSVALYMDESTDLSSTSHMLLCGTFFDKNFKFREELIEIFDVSVEGATVGAALEDCVDKVLGTTGLRKKVDVSGVESLGQPLVTWWCLAHRLNLALGDVLKSSTCVSFVKFLRLLVSFTHSSTHVGHVDEVTVKFRALATSLGELAKQLDQKISEIDEADPELIAEFKQLNEDRIENKLSEDDVQSKLKLLGRKRTLKSYFLVRWLSLFDTVDSIYNQFHILLQVLTKQAVPFTKLVASSPSVYRVCSVHGRTLSSNA